MTKYPERKEMIEKLSSAGYNVNTKTSTATLEKRWDNAIEKKLFETTPKYDEKRLRRIKDNRKHLKALRRRRGW